MDNNDIRRDILRLLHALHDESRTDLIECARLADRLKIPASRVAGNIQYLKDKQYIEVVIHKHGSRRFEYAKITSAGMDLVKNPAELNGTFPPQEVHYHYHGDYFNVKVGDHATNVVIGKDIYQLNVGSLHPLGEVVGRLMEQVSAQGDLAQPAIVEVENRLKEMLNIVREPELDLGALQAARRNLAACGGLIEAATLAFFRQPEVAARIRLATEQLIGEEQAHDPK